MPKHINDIIIYYIVWFSEFKKSISESSLKLTVFKNGEISLETRRLPPNRQTGRLPANIGNKGGFWSRFS